MPAEVTVICKGEDRTYRQKFLEYELAGRLEMSRESVWLAQLVEEAAKNYSANGEKPDTIIVKAEMVWE